MSHVLPEYLRKIITLRLRCEKCDDRRLHRCRAVGLKGGIYQQVEAICLHCERSVTR